MIIKVGLIGVCVAYVMIIVIQIAIFWGLLPDRNMFLEILLRAWPIE